MKKLKKLGLPKSSRLLKDFEMRSIIGGWDNGHYDDPPKCGADPTLYFPPQAPGTAECGGTCYVPGEGHGTCEYLPFEDGSTPDPVLYVCVCTTGV